MNFKIHFPSIRFLFILSVFLSGFSARSQEPVTLNGKVEANNADIEKIHVINLSLEKGAVTNSKGEFQIVANEGDSLYVSSVQFRNSTIIVTQKMLQEKKLFVQLEDKMNELTEVVIDDIKLSGHLASDLGKISITALEAKHKLQNELQSFIRKDREQNPYGQPVANAGLRIGKIAGSVIGKLSSGKEPPKTYTNRELANKSIAIVGQGFFRKDLNLNENEICNFIYFCSEDSRFRRLVINNNAFVLIEYFQARINDFKDRRGDLLNAPVQIPG